MDLTASVIITRATHMLDLPPFCFNAACSPSGRLTLVDNDGPSHWKAEDVVDGGK